MPSQWVDDGDAGDHDQTTTTPRSRNWLFLANAYADVGTFYGITPYVGAGIGTSYNTISHFRDTNIINGGGGYADDHGRVELRLGPAHRSRHPGHRTHDDRSRLQLRVARRRVRPEPCRTTTRLFRHARMTDFKFNDLYSHDFKLGVRYSLN